MSIELSHSGDENVALNAKRPKKERLSKSESAFRTISEVADEINVAQHVLRFWESKFKEIEPLKRGGGRRYYRPEDVEIIKKIHNLLYNQGFTIRGVQKLLKSDKRLDNLSVNTSMASLVSSEDKRTSPQASMHSNGGENATTLQLGGKSLFSASSTRHGLDDTTRKAFKILLEDLKSLRSLLKQDS